MNWWFILFILFQMINKLFITEAKFYIQLSQDEKEDDDDEEEDYEHNYFSSRSFRYDNSYEDLSKVNSLFTHKHRILPKITPPQFSKMQLPIISDIQKSRKGRLLTNSIPRISPLGTLRFSFVLRVPIIIWSKVLQLPNSNIPEPLTLSTGRKNEENNEISSKIKSYLKKWKLQYISMSPDKNQVGELIRQSVMEIIKKTNNSFGINEDDDSYNRDYGGFSSKTVDIFSQFFKNIDLLSVWDILTLLKKYILETDID